MIYINRIIDVRRQGKEKRNLIMWELLWYQRCFN